MLVEISKFDKEIAGFEPKMEMLNTQLSTELKEFNKLEAKISTIEADMSEAEKNKSKNKSHLKELAEKLKSISAKYDSVSSERESKALQIEEEISKEQITFANEETARLQAFLENKAKELEELSAELAGEVDNIDAIKETHAQEVENKNQEMIEISKQREKLKENLDNKLLIFYEKIKSWAKETAIVPIKKQGCYGCYMKLNDKLCKEISISSDVNTCPHCGRIVYMEQQA
jgi:predicted  nucleic acid-binding Zn-ribbon protein